MMAPIQSARHTKTSRFILTANQADRGGPFKRCGAVLLCVFLFQVPLLLSFLGGSFSPAYALDDRQGLTQRITGFSGEDAQEIQSALDNLEKKKNVHFWIYRTDKSYTVDSQGDSAQHSNISAAAHTLTKNFTKQDNLLMLSTYGLKTNGKCEQLTCPITVVGDWAKSKLSDDYKASLKRDLRDMVDSGEPTQAVVGFLNDLATSSAHPYRGSHAKTTGIFLASLFGVGTVGVLGAGGVTILVRRKKEKEQGKVLAREQLNDRNKLAKTPILSLDIYSKELLNSATKGIDNYGLAVRQADDVLGAANVPEFHQAYDQAKEALQKAYHIRQLLDDNIKETEAQKRSMLVELITTLQTANIKLAKTADTINAMRQDFLQAPDFVKKLVQKSIDLDRRLPASATTLEALKKSYSHEMLSPVLNNIQAAQEQLDTAKRALDSGQEYLQKGTPAALDYIHNADNSLRKTQNLLDSVDSFETNVNAIINQMPQQIQSAQNLINDAENSLSYAQVTNSATVEKVKATESQLREAIDYAQQNIHVHPFEAQQKLQEKFNDFYNIVPQFRSELTALANGMANLRSVCSSARINIGNAEHLANRVTINSDAATKLSEAKRNLEIAEASLDVTNTTAPDLKKAIDTAQKANNLAKQAVSSIQRDIDDYEQSHPPHSSSGWSYVPWAALAFLASGSGGGYSGGGGGGGGSSSGWGDF